MTEYEKALKCVREVYVKYPKRLNHLKRDLEKLDRERLDISHVIELGNLNAIDRTRLVNEYRKVSIDRREVKNEIEILEAFNLIYGKVPKEGEINRTLGNVRAIQESQKTRGYRLRVRKDLQGLLHS